ncbi:MAG: hypothetical protein OXD44_08210, partial [Gammaproteobacteria bacterium]|nr:hypothetical protein [Gammaproteobacteria bacterium]
MSNLLFTSPSICEDERDSIRENMETAWASGFNISQLDIMDLTNAGFSLLPETWRPELLREIGAELDRRAN